MTLIRALDELDAELRERDRAKAVSDDRLREVLATFRMEPPADLPEDPL